MKRPEFSKGLVIWLVGNGTVWTYLTYGFAYMGREAIAESLSTAVVTEILGVVAVYSVKALFENLSKNNGWPDRTAEGSAGAGSDSAENTEAPAEAGAEREEDQG